jgi:tryptophan synthase alpha chain
VVGSRMVQAVEQSNDQNLVDNVAALMKELRAAVDAV